MKKKNPQPKTSKLKPSLAWDLSDFTRFNEEPPPCVLEGKTEGEIMDRDQTIEWIAESVRCLRVFAEDYPEKFETQKGIYILDLEYLVSLGKISPDEKEELIKPESFNFD